MRPFSRDGHSVVDYRGELRCRRIRFSPTMVADLMIESGTLAALNEMPAMPPATYSALCKRDQRSSLATSSANLAEESCDFGRIYRR